MFAEEDTKALNYLDNEARVLKKQSRYELKKQMSETQAGLESQSGGWQTASHVTAELATIAPILLLMVIIYLKLRSRNKYTIVKQKKKLGQLKA